MILKNFTIVIFVFFPFMSWLQLSPSQEQTVDSLKNVIATAQHDSSKVKALKEWDDFVYSFDPNLDMKLLSKIDSICSNNLQKNLTHQEAVLFKEYLGLALVNLGLNKLNKADFDEAKSLFEKSYDINEELQDTLGMANSLNNLGNVFYYKGDVDQSIKYFNKSLNLRKKTNDKEAIASSINNIGTIYYSQGKLAEAIEYFTEAKKLYEQINDQKNIVSVYANIGLIYKQLKEYDKSLEYLEKSKVLNKSLNNKKRLSNDYNNLGNVQYEMKNLDKAKSYYLKAIQIQESIESLETLTYSLNNLGKILIEEDSTAKAIEILERSLEVGIKIQYNSGIASSKNYLAKAYKKINQINKAILFAENALELSSQKNNIGNMMASAEVLKECYEITGAYKKGFDMYKLYSQLKDSIESEENQNAVIRQEYKYYYDKQATVDSIENAKQQKIAEETLARQKAETEKKEAEINAQQNRQYALFGGLALVIVFSIFLYNRFRVTRRQKSIIEQQKDEVDLQKEEAEKQRDRAQKEQAEAEVQKKMVEEKNMEIMDSIQYAKRLQNAILPPLEQIKENFGQSFVLFKPKDIVSGDFYWMETTDTHTFLAAADCTGHGVPGAMVSVVCANALNKAVIELGLTNPAEILDKTRELVIQTFEKSGDDVKDGMDISLVSLAHRVRAKSESVSNKPSEGSEPSEGLLKVSYAGANNPLWIIREGGTEVEEIKADKQPIGKYGHSKPFTSHEVSLKSGDTIYLFSDGYADQFGGDKGKKMKTGSLKKLLLSYQDHQMDDQKTKLNTAFDDWKQSYEQIDDVCIIGVRF